MAPRRAQAGGDGHAVAARREVEGRHLQTAAQRRGKMLLLLVDVAAAVDHPRGKSGGLRGECARRRRRSLDRQRGFAATAPAVAVGDLEQHAAAPRQHAVRQLQRRVQRQRESGGAQPGEAHRMTPVARRRA